MKKYSYSYYNFISILRIKEIVTKNLVRMTIKMRKVYGRKSVFLKDYARG